MAASTSSRCTIWSAIEDLGLTRVDVLHAGDETYPVAERDRAVAARSLLDEVRPLTG